MARVLTGTARRTDMGLPGGFVFSDRWKNTITFCPNRIFFIHVEYLLIPSHWENLAKMIKGEGL